MHIVCSSVNRAFRLEGDCSFREIHWTAVNVTVFTYRNHFWLKGMKAQIYDQRAFAHDKERVSLLDAQRPRLLP